MNRRQALAALAAAGAACRKSGPQGWGRKEAVCVLQARDYTGNLSDEITRGLKECGLEVRGKRVLLKPNLVEHSSASAINTHPEFVAAVLESVLRLGAAEVQIGEGPGHRRDTWGLAEEAGYFEAVPEFERRFVDLNRDDVEEAGRLGTLGKLWAVRTALAADVIVSLAKMKTHHWAGVTLSMKNLFGTAPGSMYGWPKNVLHQYGIERSIVRLAELYAPTAVAIVDGIVGMEGNGPIQGKAKRAGLIAIGKNLPAVDATCCRLMGIAPERVAVFQLARRLGPSEERWIEQRGERVDDVKQRFELIPLWERLRA